MTGNKTGRFLGVPYDRWPTWARIKSRMWNAEDPRVLMPKAFGWGYDRNLHALVRRIGLLRGR